MEWTNILYLVGAAFVIWMIYRQVRNQPQMFTRANLGKSFYTMAILALILIVVVGLMIMMLRA